MKMTTEERAALIKNFREGIAGSITTSVTKGVRKGLADNDVVSDEPVSISKYLRGAVFGNWDEASQEQRLFKALGQNDPTRGGFFVPPQLSDELIEYLRASAVVRQMPGVRQIPVTGTDKIQFNRVSGAPSVTWSGEADTLTEDTGLTVEQVTLELKKITCLYKMSRELLDNAGPAVDNLVREEVAKELALEEDRVVFRGTGGAKPLGIYYQPGVLSTDLSAAVTVDNVKGALKQVRLQNATVTGFATDPRVTSVLSLEKDGNGRPILNEGNQIGSAGMTVQTLKTLLGIPLRDTTVIGTGNYPGAGESFMVGGQWDQLIIGERPGLRIETSAERYFDTDQIAIKVVKWFGYVLRHPQAFVVVKGIIV